MLELRVWMFDEKMQIIQKFLIFKAYNQSFNVLNWKCQIYYHEDSMHFLVEILFDTDSKVSVKSSNVGFITTSTWHASLACGIFGFTCGQEVV